MLCNIDSCHPPFGFDATLFSSKFTNQQHILVHIYVLPMHACLSPMTKTKRQSKFN